MSKEKDAAQREKETKLKELEFRQKSIETFATTALQQDIELRIRLADYFAAVSDDEGRKKWDAYLRTLTDRRKELRSVLDNLNDRIDEQEFKSDI
jgi:hypothetical protein